MSERTTLGERWGVVLAGVKVAPVPAPSTWDAVAARPVVTFPAEDVIDAAVTRAAGVGCSGCGGPMDTTLCVDGAACPHADPGSESSPALDEGQIVGDLLAWLYEHNLLAVPRGELLPLQVRYFMERDQ